MNELKPCPFCGGEAEILTAESMHGGYLFGIMCNDCRSRGDVFDTEAEAIKAWNTRADDQSQAAAYWQRMYEETVRERTCRNNAKSPRTFWCSECDCAVENWTDVGGTLMSVRHCPNCGAKVVS